MPEPTDPFQLDPRIAFAAERTLLAWVRTGLAMMGFGFVVARFGWLMREAGMVAPMDAGARGASLASGIALVALGVVTNVVGALQHERNMTRLRAGKELEPSASRRATLLALALGLVGVAMVGYLWLARS